MMSRRTARAVLPPLFALGLVAFVVRPMDAPVLRTDSRTLASTYSAPAAPATVVGVTVPVVAFTEHLTVTEGRLRTPVLVSTSAPTGVASVVGLTGCSVAARPGVVAWLDCAYDGDGSALTVKVELAGGVVYTHTLEPSGV